MLRFAPIDQVTPLSNSNLYYTLAFLGDGEGGCHEGEDDGGHEGEDDGGHEGEDGGGTNCEKKVDLDSKVTDCAESGGRERLLRFGSTFRTNDVLGPFLDPHTSLITNMLSDIQSIQVILSCLDLNTEL